MVAWCAKFYKEVRFINEKSDCDFSPQNEMQQRIPKSKHISIFILGHVGKYYTGNSI